jgi:hypothetical protein
LHLGSPDGIIKAPSSVITGVSDYGSFGSNLNGADFNGDGIADLCVEARFDKLLEGRIYIYPGGKKFSIEKPAFELSNPGSESLYLCLTGDLNRDGFMDVVCRSNRNWNTHQTEVSLFYGGPKADNFPDYIFTTGSFTPSLLITDPVSAGFYMIAYVNLTDLTHATRLAYYNAGSFTPFNHSIPGSIRHTSLPDEKSTRFFVVTPEIPVRLELYEIYEKGKEPKLIRTIDLPGKQVNQFNGMTFLDSNGDGIREMAIAYTDGDREKIVVIPWEP